ncbi:hypothetical protein FE257_003001 [Aspergillus nanangensis]|uniref:Ankyrin n=1 Tax=Aspergillus nanangensis TaxID=2582783 RepID=A0AAD4CCH0_ASPNN|nr:hypothetical protein FE257_003001 [Aspergillus nanangensis]
MAPDSTDEAYTKAFHAACSDGDLPKVQAALASGRLSTNTLNIALDLATEEAHPDIVNALFTAGVRITASSINSLCGKEEEDYEDPRVIRLYFDHGLKPKKCITSGGEPLLRFLNAPCARELLERGVDPNQCGPRKKTPLASALEKVYKDNGALFDLLVDFGAKIDGSLFFSAIAWSLSNTVIKTKFLLNKGLDPNTICANWGTPLLCAVRFGMEDIVQILLDAGADPTARPECKQFRGDSPSELAESQIHAKDDPCMEAHYRSIIKRLADAKGRRNTSTKTENRSQLEQRSMDVKHRYATKPTAKKQKFNTKHTTVNNTSKRGVHEGSISSRTRSRTKIIS